MLMLLRMSNVVMAPKRNKSLMPGEETKEENARWLRLGPSSSLQKMDRHAGLLCDLDFRPLDPLLMLLKPLLALMGAVLRRFLITGDRVQLLATRVPRLAGSRTP